MFEETFLLHREKDPPRRLSLPVAIALHGLVLAGIVGGSVWFDDEPPEPSVPVIFYKTALPAAAGGPAGSSRPRAASEKRRQSAAPIRLAQIPSSSSEVSPLEEIAGPVVEDTRGNDDELVPGSGIGIMPSGRPGGILNDPAGEQGIFRPGGEVRSPVLVRRVEPDYPEAARRARIEGVVILDAIITASGDVEDVRVVRSAGALLDSAAGEAVRRWAYRPATLNGRPVRVFLTVTVDFRVH